MDYKESSKILKFFTRDLGRISVMAQGSYKKSSKSFSATNLFNVAQYDLNEGRNFYYLKETNLIASNSFITSDLGLVASSNLVIEVINKVLEEGAKEVEIYELTRGFFMGLKEDPSNHRLRLVSYLLKFSSFLGFQPDFTSCLLCRTTKALSYKPVFSRGGLICGSCMGQKSLDDLTRSEFLLLNQLLYSKTANLAQIKPSQDVRLFKILMLVIDFLKTSFEIDHLNSESWIRRTNI